MITSILRDLISLLWSLNWGSLFLREALSGKQSASKNLSCER